MSIGLVALLDDVAAIAKVAAASLDDIAGQAAKASAKAAGVVIDDAAVTPRYVTGFSASRELPIIGKITLGSLRNKLIFLLPIALVLSLFAPWAITPLLMLGGLYLSYEGAEKVYEALVPHGAQGHEAALEPVTLNAVDLEDQKVASAIKTDFILSSEIMAITLAAIPAGSLPIRAAVLALVGIGITLGVYGAVALIVKMDDIGLALARHGHLKLTRALGRGLVVFMPWLLRLLGIIGTAAMIWVGGGILMHGLESFGFSALAHLVEGLSEQAAHAVPAMSGAVGWLVGAACSGIFGLAVGAVAIPVATHVVAPVWRAIKTAFGRPVRKTGA
jgi:predicted DNA repair protein MutK